MQVTTSCTWLKGYDLVEKKLNNDRVYLDSGKKTASTFHLIMPNQK